MFTRFQKWHRRWFAPRQTGSSRTRSRRPSWKPGCELLEDRTLMSVSSLVHPGPNGHLVYTPDAQGNIIPDFSNIGYLSGTVPLPGTDGTPDVPVKKTIQPPPGLADATAVIQAAIDEVSKLPLN